MSSFILKMIAVITMLMDHSGDALIGNFSWLNIIGRIAFPLFAFQLVIGYRHTHNLKKYMLRMLIFAAISQAPFSILNKKVDPTILNIFVTLFFGLAVLALYDMYIELHGNKYFLFLKNKKRIPILSKTKEVIPKNESKNIISKNKVLFFNIVKFIYIILIIILCQAINTDYGSWGILLILLIHIFYPYQTKIVDKQYSSIKQVKVSKYSVMSFLMIMFGMSLLKYVDLIGVIKTYNVIYLTIFTFIPSILMLLYNGKKGKECKMFFYIFYPAHLIILDILRAIIF